MAQQAIKMTEESKISKDIRLSITENLPNCTIFRNNTGRLKTDTGRVVTFGLTVGSSDLIGWTTATITPDMVGQKVAIFTAIEVKTEKGKVKEQQEKFINNVINSGGIAKVVRSPDETINFLKSCLK